MKRQIAFFFGTADLSGAPKMGYYFAKAFVRAGYRVVAIVGRRPTAGISVVDLLQKEGVEVIFEHGFGALWSMSLVRRCTTHLRPFRPQLIITVVQNDLKIAALVARRLDVPLVIMGQSFTTFYGPFPLRNFKKWMYGRLVRGAQSVVGASEVVSEHYRRVYRVPGETVTMISNGIELEEFQLRPSPGSVDGRRVRLLNVGRLDVQKGQDILLDALASLPPQVRSTIQLQLVGGATLGSPPSEEYSKKLRSRSADPELKGLVEFCGWRDDVPELLRQSDVYVHSARWEGLGLAIVEAMAVGLPVIYTDAAGRFEGFEDGVHGYMVKAGDTGGLALAMMQILELTTDQKAEMGRKARQLACEHYDISVLGARFVALCSSLIK